MITIFLLILFLTFITINDIILHSNTINSYKLFYKEGKNEKNTNINNDYFFNAHCFMR